MTTQTTPLPHQSGHLFLTDGGLETTLVFHDGIELPHFAAFDLLKDEAGTRHLESYYQRYIDLALDHGVGFVLESATWRANSDWGDRLGYSADSLHQANVRSIEMLDRLRTDNQNAASPMVISGNLGPRGDGYSAAIRMTEDEATEYHMPQIRTLSEAGADMITALTLTYPEEAIGITRAAQAVGIPVVISFTVETDGRLPNEQPLQAAIEQVDAATASAPAYYMINCAHPTHFHTVLGGEQHWLSRIGGIRANASCKSHAELDESETLDEGNPDELGGQYQALRQMLPALKVVGGCCGTDHRHVDAIARACSRAWL